MRSEIISSASNCITNMMCTVVDILVIAVYMTCAILSFEKQPVLTFVNF